MLNRCDSWLNIIPTLLPDKSWQYLEHFGGVSLIFYFEMIGVGTKQLLPHDDNAFMKLWGNIDCTNNLRR